MLNVFNQCSDRPSINLPTECLLNTNFVAFSNCNVSHIVIEAHNLQIFAECNTNASAHPIAKALLNIIIFPVSSYNFSRHTKTRRNKTMLAITMIEKNRILTHCRMDELFREDEAINLETKFNELLNAAK